MRSGPFLFSGNEKQDLTESVKIEINHKIQVIVCGSLSQEFIQALSIPNFKYSNTEYYAFIVEEKGNLTIEVTVTIISDIDYKEDRHKSKKKQSLIEFKHDDRIDKKVNTSYAGTTQYYQCSPDFKSTITTYVLILGNDIRETKSIVTKMGSMPQFPIQGHYIIRGFEGSQEIPYNAASAHHIMSSNDDDILELTVKKLKKELKKCHEEHLKIFTNQTIDDVIDHANLEMETKIRQQADDYFDEQQRHKCSIM